VDDAKALAELNFQFIEACRQGSWPMLQPILSGSSRRCFSARWDLAARPPSWSRW
jgi:hypothetical protein